VPLSQADRQRAAARLRHALDGQLDTPTCSIPVTDEQWSQFVSRLQHLPDAITDVDAVVKAAVDSGDFRALQAASDRAASLFSSSDSLLWPGCTLDHPRRPAAVELRAQLVGLANMWLASIGAVAHARVQNDRSREPAAESAAEVLRALDVRGERPVRDPWVAAFGVTRASLCASNGEASVPLLIAAFHARLDELWSRVERILKPLAPFGLEPVKAIEYCLALLDSDDPAAVVQTALHVRRLIAERFARSPEHTAAALGALLDGVQRSHANLTMLQDTAGRMEATSRLDVRAMLTLDYYRRMVEGQVKPWCWTLVRLHTDALLSDVVADHVGVGWRH